ncbi:UDP-N-acetylglucosamine 4,6-dehydratase (inverting) [Alphaproteobacteria bacterium]|nr:UDP-N-acetylglucosamine 4,6-dehydratase (inverting) [Alphaproteobacteria bacterium]
MKNCLTNSVILLTGGTGSFGKAFTEMTLKTIKPKRIIIFSRDEMKQWEMAKDYENNDKIKFIIGDVRDKNSLIRAFEDVDYVVHAAATKIVPTAEINPFECVKTNIEGAMNVIEVATQCKVKKIIALSTDKASNPINLYGATKLASDKLFIASNNFEKNNSIKFSIVRYGNVMGSRGSVIPYFLSTAKKGVINITDKRMTRFMITLEDAINLVWFSFKDMKGGEIYVKKIPSIDIISIANSINKNAKKNIIGIRPGEKLHEQMIGFEDADNTLEFKDYFKILPSIKNQKKRYVFDFKNGKKVKSDFIYVSNKNKKWMTVAQLSKWINKNFK